MNLLTDKAKEKFEEWYFEKHVITAMEYEELLPHHRKDIYGWFYNLDISFQWGVILEFADSLGYILSMDYVCYTYEFAIISFYKEEYYIIYEDLEGLETRKEAQIEAIKHLNQLINKDKQA